MCANGEAMIAAGHYGEDDIKRKIAQLNSRWQQLKVCVCVEDMRDGGRGWRDDREGGRRG